MLTAALSALVGSTTAARRPEVVAEVGTLVEAADPAAVAWCQRAIADRRDSFDILDTTAVPAVVIAGAEDILVPAEETKRMANALPLGEYVVIPDTGHLAALEAPAAVSDALLDLLGRMPC